jgi:hypothetical protein
VNEIKKSQKAAGHNRHKKKNQFPEEPACFPVVPENSDLPSDLIHNAIS